MFTAAVKRFYIRIFRFHYMTSLLSLSCSYDTIEKILYQGILEKRGYFRRNFLPRYFVVYGHHDNFLVEYYDYAGGTLKGKYMRIYCTFILLIRKLSVIQLLYMKCWKR